MYNLRGTDKANTGRGSGKAGRSSAPGRHRGPFGRGPGITGTTKQTNTGTTETKTTGTTKPIPVPIVQVKQDSTLNVDKLAPVQVIEQDPIPNIPDDGDPDVDDTINDKADISEPRWDDVQMKMGRDNLRNLLALFDFYIEIDERLLAILEELGLYDDLTFMDYTCEDINAIFRSIFFSGSIRTEGHVYETDEHCFEYTVKLTATIVIIHEFFANIEGMEYENGRFPYDIGYDTLLENELATIDEVTEFVLESEHHQDDLRTMFKNISDRIIDGVYCTDTSPSTRRSRITRMHLSQTEYDLV